MTARKGGSKERMKEGVKMGHKEIECIGGEMTVQRQKVWNEPTKALRIDVDDSAKLEEWS